MSELVWIVDPTTGDLFVEGLGAAQAATMLDDVLPAGIEVNCAQPLSMPAVPTSQVRDGPTLRIAGLWHGSVVEGPGRRSVLQVQGCPLRCHLCSVPDTHSPEGGRVLPVDVLVDALLDPAGAPRDGVTVLGGEPMAQPVGLAALLRELKARGIHTVVYTGYTLKALVRRGGGFVRSALECTDLLIDGPYIAELADKAGEWRGSRNQRLIPNPAGQLAAGAVEDLLE